MKSIINQLDCPNSAMQYDFSVFDKIEDRKAKISLMLLTLEELSSLKYKAECGMREYWIEPFAETFNSYSKQTKELREKIIKEMVD